MTANEPRPAVRALMLAAARQVKYPLTIQQVDAETDDNQTLVFYLYDAAGELQIVICALPEPLVEFNHRRWSREMRVSLLAAEILRRAEEYF